MLARTPSSALPAIGGFLSADELGLTDAYYKGLVEVLRRLDARMFRQITSLGPSLNNHACFNIGVTWLKTECGTVGCIAGWAAFFAGSDSVCGLQESFYSDNATSSHIWAHDDLTMPPGWNGDTSKFTQEVCAVALRAYLETGRADWSAAGC